MDTDEEDDDWDDDIAITQTMVNTNMALMMEAMDEDGEEKQVDHRTLPRRKKRIFRPDEATHCIRRDYLGIVGDPTTPIFDGKQFQLILRLSKTINCSRHFASALMDLKEY